MGRCPPRRDAHGILDGVHAAGYPVPCLALGSWLFASGGTFCTKPPDPPCPEPELDDILCLLDDFADGVGVDGCGTNDPPESTDLFPCADGDGAITLDDILCMLDAFAGNPPCDDPCA